MHVVWAALVERVISGSLLGLQRSHRTQTSMTAVLGWGGGGGEGRGEERRGVHASNMAVLLQWHHGRGADSFLQV